MLMNCDPLGVKLLHFGRFETSIFGALFVLPALFIVDKSVVCARERLVIAMLEVGVLGVIFLSPNLIRNPLIPGSIAHFIILLLELTPGLHRALDSHLKCRHGDRHGLQGACHLLN